METSNSQWSFIQKPDLRYRDCIRSVIQDALESDSYGVDPIKANLNLASDTCARLLAVAPYDLAEGMRAYAAHLAGEGPPSQYETSLRRLACIIPER